MKNFKRTLALVLAVIMVVGMFASVSAASAKWYAQAVRYIESVGIASIGSTAEDKITRDEFVLWVAKLESGNINDSYWSSAMETPFTDIGEENNQTAIWYAARRGLIEGNGDGTFAPDKNIEFAEAAAVIVRLMRYQSKVEGDAEDWQWANMEVANEYCNAFTNTFLDNVGGGTYAYDYELTKGEAAYLLATIMNSTVIENGAQVNTNDYGKTTYKSLTIDGMNLGERFNGREGQGVTNNTYMVDYIHFDENGEIDVKNVGLRPINAANKYLNIEADDFTSLVRVYLGLSAEAAEGEAEIRVVDTVKIGNVVEIVLDEEGEPVSIAIHEGSTVVDTHIVMDSMLGTDYNGYGIVNWTAGAVVSGASNSNEYREAIINGTWSSDLLYTWSLNKEKTVATLTFKGEEYDFKTGSFTWNKGEANEVTYTTVYSDDITVYYNAGYGLNSISNYARYETQSNISLEYFIEKIIPDVATGEVTLIFNDNDLDGEYDTLIINEKAQEFKTVFVDNKTVNNNYYAEGYSISDTASGKLNLVVLAKGRFPGYTTEDKDGDRSVKDETATVKEGNFYNYMNAYQVAELATISSGIIEESTLRTYGNDTTYYVITVKNAAGAREKIYIPFNMPAATEIPTFEYTINGVTKEYTPDVADWDVTKKLDFINKIPGIIGVATDAAVGTYANYAAKLVGQYISYIVDEDGVAIYCVSGAATDSTGYVLDIEATDVDNMYNATILTVDDNGNAKDVAIYSVNATASVMMNKAGNYEVIADLFNKGTLIDGKVYNNDGLSVPVYDEKGVATTHQASLVTKDSAKYNIASLINVDVHSNGTFTYIQIADSEKGIRFDREDGIWNINLNSDANVDTDADEWGDLVLNGATFAKDKDNKDTGYVEVVSGGTKPTATVTYSGEFYANPIYRFDSVNNKWTLSVSTQTVTVEYTFDVDTMTITTANVLSIETSDADLYEALVAATELDRNGKKVLKTLATWVNLRLDEDGEVTAVEVYAVPTETDGVYNQKGFDRGTEDKTAFVVAGKVVVNDDKSISVDYDFRGIDFTYDVVSDKITMKELTGVTGAAEKAYYTFGDAKVDTADVLVALEAAAEYLTVAGTNAGNFDETVNPEVFVKKATDVAYSATVKTTKADAESSISNVTFTKIEAGTKGYIPGSYYFSIDGADKVYFNNLKDHANQKQFVGYTDAEIEAYLAANTALDEEDISSADRKYRVTTNTEVVLLTPAVSGWTVRIMTPAEAAELDLIVTGVSFIDEIAADKPASDKYNPYEYKLDALVLVGQEALVATDAEVEVDDGLEVGKGEYLVWVPADVETILVAPEGSKTVKVATTKSVYAIPSGTEVGAIYYEYDVYAGAESAVIKTSITSGWYIVEEDGEIIGTFNMGKQNTDKKSNAFKNAAYVTVEGGKVVANAYKEGNKKDKGLYKSYDLESATILYYDIDGTLKVAENKTAQFAGDAVFQLVIKSAKTAYENALAAYENAVEKDFSETKQAELKAALADAQAAYEEALATNIDKYFNGNIWASFKNAVAQEEAIQGNVEYVVTVYEVDGKVFVIVNDWDYVDGGVATVTSAFN